MAVSLFWWQFGLALAIFGTRAGVTRVPQFHLLSKPLGFPPSKNPLDKYI
jgi:hypothetical protein